MADEWFKQPHYDVVLASNVWDLRKEVDMRLLNGFVLHGPLIVARRVFADDLLAQGLYRPPDKEIPR